MGLLIICGEATTVDRISGEKDICDGGNCWMACCTVGWDKTVLDIGEVVVVVVICWSGLVGVVGCAKLTGGGGGTYARQHLTINKQNTGSR